MRYVNNKIITKLRNAVAGLCRRTTRMETLVEHNTIICYSAAVIIQAK